MTLTLVFIFISALVCLFGPVTLAVILIVKRGAKFWMFLLGAAVFTVFQILTRIPLLNLLQNTAWYTMFKITQPALVILLLAFTAGLFEEAGRFIGIRFLPKHVFSWENALVFGLGHGGMEAIYLVGLNYAIMFVQMLSGHASAEILNVVMMTPASYFLAAGVERVLAVAMHIGFTMLVFYAVKRRKPLYLLAAVAAHTAVDAAVPLLRLAGVPLGVMGGGRRAGDTRGGGGVCNNTIQTPARTGGAQ